MPTQIETINIFTKSVHLEFSKDNYQKVFTKSLNKIAKQISLPGFRPGKVPVEMVQKRFHQDVHAETVDSLVKKGFEEACLELNINPLAVIELKNVNHTDENGLTCDIVFEVRPEISSLNYKNLTIEYQEEKLNEDHVKQEYEQLMIQLSGFEPADESAELQNGQVAMFDLYILQKEYLDSNFETLVGLLKNHDPHHHHDDAQFNEWFKTHNHGLSYEIGNKTFDEKIESQMLGMKVNEYRHVKVISKVKNEAAELIEKTEDAIIKLNYISKRIPPVLNDEFFKKFKRPGVDSEESLKQYIRNNIVRKVERDNLKNCEHAFMEKIIESNEFEVPNAMVENYLNFLYNEQKLGNRLSEKRFKMAFEDMAKSEVKWELIKEYISKTESLKFANNDERLDAVKTLFNEANINQEEMDNYLANETQIENISYQLENKRLIEFLKKENNITIKEENREA